MKWTSKLSFGTVLLAASLLCLPACKKRQAQAMVSDLQQAGYQLTADDWFRASRTNDVEAMKKFIAAKFDPKTQDAAGNVALHHAAIGGAQKTAAFLLDRRLPIDARNAEERTPLMLAVMNKQALMTNYLLRQGADPQAKDKNGYTPLMLAVQEGSANCVSELATYSRNELDAALLLSAMEGKPEVIDALTNYGASVYARMEDGRTPLMIAAENGQMDAVKLLTELGSSRFTTDAEGKTAADLATAAGFPEIATYLAQDPAPAELALESDEQVAQQMDAYVDAAAAENPALEPDKSAAPASTAPTTKPAKLPARSLHGQILSQPVLRDTSATSQRPGTPAAPPDFAAPPIVMRHYREREVPVEIRSVEGDTAILSVAGKPDTRVSTGQPIPGSNLVVIRVLRRMESSKLNLGQPTEVSVVEVRDTTSGTTRQWIAGVPSRAHDPAALVEDAATGQRYVAAPGQRFTAADGSEFIVSDVRPSQIIIESAATGEVKTIPLSGPRG